MVHEITAAQQSILLDRCLRELLNQELLLSSSAIDIKGIDSKSKEKLLSIRGEVFLSETERDPFELDILTHFQEFDGVHHIKHSLEEIRAGSLPNFVQTQNLGRVFPLNLTEWSIGLEIFESRRTLVLGYAPQATQSLEIKCSVDKLEIEISTESQEKKETLPLQKLNLLEKLDKILSDVINLRISDSWKAA
ncbi:MAG: hypothetical protein H6619_00365 [Deltaproteobacteria bacterium]|nr:hypothetical protein [Deltaproteobacteria bacterium]